MTILATVFIWYLNQNIKLRFNYEHRKVSGSAVNDGTFFVFQTRLEWCI
jgi:hypothetical protein